MKDVNDKRVNVDRLQKVNFRSAWIIV